MKFPWSRKPAVPKLLAVDPTKVDTLSGTFELRAGRVSGFARDDLNRREQIGSVTIVVQRHDRPILHVPTTLDTRHGAHRFEFAIEGVLEPREFISGAITLTACSQSGAQGLINQDGANTLTLVRSFLSDPAETLIELDFAKGGNAREHMRAGWSGTEQNYTWTEGPESILSFPTLIRQPGKYALRIVAGGLVIDPIIPSQYLETYLNGTLLDTHTLKKYEPDFMEIKFSGEAFVDQPLELRLYHPDCARPSELNAASNDTRQLAMSMKQLTLVRFL